MPRSPQGRLRNRSRPAACVYLNTCRTAHIQPRVICTCTAVHASVPRPLGHGPARPWLCECMRAAARSIHRERSHHANAPLKPCRMLESFGDTPCMHIRVREIVKSSGANPTRPKTSTCSIFLLYFCIIPSAYTFPLLRRSSMSHGFVRVAVQSRSMAGHSTRHGRCDIVSYGRRVGDANSASF